MKKLTAILVLIVFCIFFTLIIDAATPKKKRKSTRIKTVPKIETVYTPDPKIGDWISQFTSYRVSGKDSAIPLVGLSEAYKSLNEHDKNGFRKQLTDSLAAYLKRKNNPEALALIDLYDFIVPDNVDDKKKAIFVKGNLVAAERDSVTLKEAIAWLEKNNAPDYASKLHANLTEIRNYVPADKGIEGMWISYNLFNLKDCNPYTRIEVTYPSDSTKFCLMNDNAGASFAYYGDKYDKLSFPFAQDSIYILWSTEKLKEIDADLATGLRSVTGTTASLVTSTLSQRNKYGTAGSLGGAVLGSVIEIGLGAAIDAWMTPNKKVALVEAKLRKDNPHHLSGTIRYFNRTIDANGNIKNSSDTTYEVRMIKALPVSHHSPYFIDYGSWVKLPEFNTTDPDADVRKILSEHPELLERKDVKKALGLKKDDNTLVSQVLSLPGIDNLESYQKKIIIAAWGGTDEKWKNIHKNFRSHNVQTFRKNLYYRAPELKQLGIDIYSENGQPSPKVVAVMGFEINELTEKEVKKQKLTDSCGALVTSLPETSPARLSAIKKGDIIVSVNGKKITNCNDLRKTIQGYNPFETVTLGVIRKKKTVEIKLELTSAYLYE